MSFEQETMKEISKEIKTLMLPFIGELCNKMPALGTKLNNIVRGKGYEVLRLQVLGTGILQEAIERE